MDCNSYLQEVYTNYMINNSIKIGLNLTVAIDESLFTLWKTDDPSSTIDTR